MVGSQRNVDAKVQGNYRVKELVHVLLSKTILAVELTLPELAILALHVRSADRQIRIEMAGTGCSAWAAERTTDGVGESSW